MAQKLHSLLKGIQMPAQGYGYGTAALCWVNGEPLWVTRTMVVREDPQLNNYFGTFHLRLLLDDLQKQGELYQKGPVSGYYVLASRPPHHLHIVDRQPIRENSSLDNLENFLNEHSRRGLTGSINLSTVIIVKGRKHYQLVTDETPTDNIPPNPCLPQEQVDYLRCVHPQLFTMGQITYDYPSVYFQKRHLHQNKGLFAAISIVNPSLFQGKVTKQRIKRK